MQWIEQVVGCFPELAATSNKIVSHKKLGPSEKSILIFLTSFETFFFAKTTLPNLRFWVQ